MSSLAKTSHLPRIICCLRKPLSAPDAIRLDIEFLFLEFEISEVLCDGICFSKLRYLPAHESLLCWSAKVASVQANGPFL
jgi:hypothetical protein